MQYYDESFSIQPLYQDCPSRVEGKHSYRIHYCGFDEFKPTQPKRVGEEKWHLANKAKGYDISIDTKGVLLCHAQRSHMGEIGCLKIKSVDFFNKLGYEYF